MTDGDTTADFREARLRRCEFDRAPQAARREQDALRHERDVADLRNHLCQAQVQLAALRDRRSVRVALAIADILGRSRRRQRGARS